MQTVDATWNGREYRAQLDHFGVAVIGSESKAISDHAVNDHELMRLADNGGACCVCVAP